MRGCKPFCAISSRCPDQGALELQAATRECEVTVPPLRGLRQSLQQPHRQCHLRNAELLLLGKRWARRGEGCTASDSTYPPPCTHNIHLNAFIFTLLTTAGAIIRRRAATCGERRHAFKSVKRLKCGNDPLLRNSLTPKSPQLFGSIFSLGVNIFNFSENSVSRYR
jgi:hypothetical protein